MNRIREHNNKYEVLITPHQKYNTGFEFLLGCWTDETLSGFYVKEFNNFNNARNEAVKYPDINWNQLVDFHRDIFVLLKSCIQKIIKYSDMALQFKPILLTPEEAKNKMFDRVLNGVMSMNSSRTLSDFRLIYDFNDIISFSIVNPWTKNLREFANHLKRSLTLNIIATIEKNDIVHLIGKTSIGTTYEIVLASSVLNNWMEWKNINSKLSVDQHMSTLKDCIKLQEHIDRSFVVR
jgi:hypothetical protein